MKKTISAILTLLLVGLFGIGMTVSAQSDQGEENFVKVFIHFNEDAPLGVRHGLVSAFGGELSHSFSIIEAVAAKIPEGAIDGLSSNPHVMLIEEDHEVAALGVTYDQEYENSWGVERLESGVAHEDGNKGAGVKIGIIDSGINYNHPDLAANYKGGYDFYYYDNDAMDVYGHGTHVAGTACAEDNDNGLGSTVGVVGVAPECDLYSLRVLGDSGSGYESDIVYAVEWALGRTIDIYWNGVYQTTVTGERMDVVNLSLGRSSAYTLASELTFQEAADEGLIIVAAAGNSGNRNGKGTNTIYPANYPSVIAVAATKEDDSRATFSSTGPNVELAAPGQTVYSTWNDVASYSNPQPNCTGVLVDINGDGEADGECYKFGSGTSMASPHVAGVAALLIKSGLVTDTNGDGNISDEIRTLMQTTAIDLGSTGHDTKYGYGLVNVANALEAVAPVATGVLEGYVTDASSTPIIGATVTAGTFTAVTDSFGYYIMSDIEIGDYSVNASATGFSDASDNAIITENTTTSVNFSLFEAPVVDIALIVEGYKVKGVHHADLTWTSDGAGTIDILRDGSAIITTSDDGFYTDNIGNKGGGSYNYQVCDTGTSNCSLIETLTF